MGDKMNININSKNEGSAELMKSTLETSEKFSNKSKKKMPFSFKDIFEYGKLIVFAFMIAYIINHFIIANAIVPTGSMETTVMPNDRVLAFRLSYLFDEPQRGDIIIFQFPDDENQDFLKRIVGMPGDIIDIVDGKVFINDGNTPLEENYLKDIPKGNYGPYEVPVDSYFVMGDNRDNSFDSRFWDNSFVKRDKIIAKAIFRYFPTFQILE